jgi:carbon-monoxide dehydrogenase medium subunit
MEERLRGASATAEAVASASEAIGDDIEPVNDAHGSADYRRRMARVVARRAVNEAIARGASR